MALQAHTEQVRGQGDHLTGSRAALPLLSEGKTYVVEFAFSETAGIAKLLRIIDDMPLGRGFSFQLPTKRIFVYERDLRPGPDGSLLIMG